MTSRLLTLCLLAGCSGSATLDDGAQDSDVVLDTSQTPIEPDPTDTDVAVVALPCHAWDPLDVSGGSRTYRLTAGDTVSTETHTLGAAINVPRLPDNSYGVKVVNDADPATDVLTINGCRDGDEPGAVETAFDGTVSGLDMVGLTEAGLKYLPPPEALDNRRRPSWSSAVLWALDVDVSVPTCPNPLLLKRTTSAEYAVVGRETLTVPGLGEVEAAHIEVVQAERVDTRGNPSATCERTLEEFDVIGPATRTNVRAHRWYVRGVGLVLGLVVDPADNDCKTITAGEVPEGCTPVLERRMTACSGLAGCP